MNETFGQRFQRLRKNESKIEEGKQPLIPPEFVTRELLKTLYACLKRVIKRHGHFNLVEVDARDGARVTIRV